MTTTTRSAGRIGLLTMHIVTSIRSSFRSAEFAVGAVGIPVLLYVMFGLPNASNVLPSGTGVGAVMLVSMASYGVISLAIFTFGEYLAKERGSGWIRTLRATPFPNWVHFVGKSVTATVHALMIVAALGFLAATFGGVTEHALTWFAFGALMIGGVLIFSTLGFAIVYLVRPRAAVAISNVIFLPLSFASGFFVPLSELPDVVGNIAPYLPTFHFGQLGYRLFMPVSDIEAWTGAVTPSLWVNVAWVLGSALLFGAVATWAARREAVTRRG